VKNVTIQRCIDMNSEKKECKKCNKEFVLDINDLNFYKKMDVPNPDICPDCRFKDKAIFRNEMSLYSGRKCDLCKKNMITMYNPNSPYKVFCIDCYQGDGWDSKDYQMDYDANRPFFDQFKELLEKVPKAAIYRTNSSGPNINSDYVNMSGGLKNCYFVFNSGPAEDCLYSRGIKNTNDLSDIYFSTKSNLLYECVNVHNSSRIVFGDDIFGSVDCYFSLNLNNCQNCFGCINLRNRKFHILNKRVAKEEYENFLSEILGSYEKMENFKKEFEKFSINFPRRENHNLKNENVSGDYINNSKNVEYSFEVVNSENCKYLFSSKDVKDSIGTIGFGFKSELLLECVSVGFSSNIIGSYAVDLGLNILYSFFCYPNNNNLIGCDSMKNSSFCILNKQYTKEEFNKLKIIILEELKEKNIYGLMIPNYLSPFAYNETIAQDNMPLSKEEALSFGYKWEENIQKTEGKETLLPENIPDHIKDITEDILKEILKCIDCNRNYRITNQEFTFYKRMNLPIPRKCFYCRHKDRIKRRGPYKFWKRNCNKCRKEIITNYAPERSEIVYCEQCYQKEVY